MATRSRGNKLSKFRCLRHDSSMGSRVIFASSPFCVSPVFLRTHRKRVRRDRQQDSINSSLTAELCFCNRQQRTRSIIDENRNSQRTAYPQSLRCHFLSIVRRSDLFRCKNQPQSKV